MKYETMRMVWARANEAVNSEKRFAQRRIENAEICFDKMRIAYEGYNPFADTHKWMDGVPRTVISVCRFDYEGERYYVWEHLNRAANRFIYTLHREDDKAV